MAKATLFMNNRSQAVRIPKALAFGKGVREVEIERDGDALILRPAGAGWRNFLERGPFASADFLTEREDGFPEERDPL